MPENKDKKYVWHKVADSALSIQWQENDMCILDAGDKKITLSRFNGQLYAFAQKCPHASGIMADGYIDAVGNIVCPVHRYKFNLQNGRNTTGEGYYLKTYPVEQRPDGLFVGMADTGLFGW